MVHTRALHALEEKAKLASAMKEGGALRLVAMLSDARRYSCSRAWRKWSRTVFHLDRASSDKESGGRRIAFVLWNGALTRYGRAFRTWCNYSTWVGQERMRKKLEMKRVIQRVRAGFMRGGVLCERAFDTRLLTNLFILSCSEATCT